MCEEEAHDESTEQFGRMLERINELASVWGSPVTSLASVIRCDQSTLTSCLSSLCLFYLWTEVERSEPEVDRSVSSLMWVY